MTNDAIKTYQAKARSIRARQEALRIELADPHTQCLGRAAVECVRQSLMAADRELEELKKTL